MHTLITGAGGFIGHALAERIANTLGPADRLTLVDLRAPAMAPDPRIRIVAGSLASAAVLGQAIDAHPDRVFHLATVPGRAAEEDFSAGKAANLDATIALLEALRVSGCRPRVVYSSSVAVYGAPMPPSVDDDTLPQPTLSYAAHKLAGEILVNDYTRHGFIDGLSVRLGGIVARPKGSTANASMFLNDLFHAAREHQAFTLPMEAKARSWLMSLDCCIDNLLHAAELSPDVLPLRRNWALPILAVSMADLVTELAQVYGEEVTGLVSYRPEPAVEHLFRQPPMQADQARQLGFRDDGTVAELVKRVAMRRTAMESALQATGVT